MFISGCWAGLGRASVILTSMAIVLIIRESIDCVPEVVFVIRDRHGTHAACVW